jgi:hypothetical protein
MKKIIKSQQVEEAEYFCDLIPGQKAFSHLKLHSWYGSNHDMLILELDLCDDAVDEIMELLRSKYGDGKIKFKDYEAW